MNGGCGRGTQSRRRLDVEVIHAGVGNQGYGSLDKGNHVRRRLPLVVVVGGGCKAHLDGAARMLDRYAPLGCRRRGHLGPTGKDGRDHGSGHVSGSGRTDCPGDSMGIVASFWGKVCPDPNGREKKSQWLRRRRAAAASNQLTSGCKGGAVSTRADERELGHYARRHIAETHSTTGFETDALQSS